MKTRILVVDDHKIIRDGLRLLFQQQSDMEVIAEADNGQTALQLVRKLKPNVMVLDISMPQLNGIDLAMQISSEFPEVKMIALSMHTDRRFVEAMLAANVSGYVLKRSAFEELAGAVRWALAGRVFLSPYISDIVVKAYMNGQKIRGESNNNLTAREREILQLLSEGNKTKGIASQLHISIKTVDTHRRQIMTKLNVESIAELTKFAIREGLTSLEA
ncbi:MAG: response regulator transcription factor [Proteobacteria bacterium]|nr:response regulator transcription factor [Pseudomonadota bacterium]